MSAYKLFRDGEFAGLCDYAERLEREVERLTKELEQTMQFGGYTYFSKQRNEAERRAFALAARVQQLTDELESHAWEVTPAMAQARIDQLNAEVERLRADKERLDWLDAVTPHIFWSAVCNHPMNPEGECAVAIGANEVFYAKSYRAAIDAARAQGGAK